MRKKIIYSQHLIIRLSIRRIPYSLPEEIYKTAKERYFDKATLNNVVIKEVKFMGKVREMAVIYTEASDSVMLITIHPLKNYQKFSRIKSGRWQKL